MTKIDNAQQLLIEVQASLSSILSTRAGAPYPFRTVLKLLRDVRQGNFYLAQLAGGAAARLQTLYDAVVLRMQGLGATTLRAYLFERWGEMISTGDAGSSFSRATWAAQVKELNEHLEVLDSEFVEDADRANLLTDWATTFGQIEAVWKDKVVA